MIQNQHKDIIIPLAIKAGKEIMKYYCQNFETEYKSDNSPVTEADIASNNVIIAGLQLTGIPVISEESINMNYQERKNLEKFWIVDPLDGTKQFVKNEDEFTVNIALVINNIVVEGVVYAPAKNSLYYGNILSGAFMFDSSTWPSEEFEIPCYPSNKTRIVASKSHLNTETLAFINDIYKLFSDAETVNIGSSLKFCLVAEGKADIYPRIGSISEWDIAAGHAVLKAAGGNVLNLETGVELTYNSETLKTPDYIALKNVELYNKLKIRT
jgi:3'(2'), 5'-bisphosphate nucleotidase